MGARRISLCVFCFVFMMFTAYIEGSFDPPAISLSPHKYGLKSYWGTSIQNQRPADLGKSVQIHMHSPIALSFLRSALPHV